MSFYSNWRADRLHTRAQRLSDAGMNDEALRLYEEALALNPHRATTCYNIGLIHKYRLNWPESLRFNARAYELNPADEATRWNYAIAATALRDWTTARRLWAQNGVKLEDGTGPIEADFGLAPLRLNPETNGEVVWGTRIDPARAKIESVPLPDSGYRHRDVVLNDGAPVGYRMLNGSKKPVFNVLQLYEGSRYSTYVVVLEVADPDSLKSGLSAAERLNIAVEDWTDNLQMLCKQCSERLPHHDHDRELPQTWHPNHRIGVAAEDRTRVSELIEVWRAMASIKVLEQALVLQA